MGRAICFTFYGYRTLASDARCVLRKSALPRPPDCASSSAGLGRPDACQERVSYGWQATRRLSERAAFVIDAAKG